MRLSTSFRVQLCRFKPSAVNPKCAVWETPAPGGPARRFSSCLEYLNIDQSDTTEHFLITEYVVMLVSIQKSKILNFTFG